MPSGSFKTQGYSPPHRRALHLLVFSTSSSSPPPHLLHHLVFFSTPASCFPCPSSPLGFLPRHPIVVVGLRCAWPEFPGSSIRWPLHSAWEERGGVAPLPSTPSPFFLCGSLYRRCISLVVVRFVGHYAGVILPRCCLPSCWLLVVRYAGIGLLSLLQVSSGKPLAEAVVTTQAVGSGCSLRRYISISYYGNCPITRYIHSVSCPPPKF